MIQNSIKNAKSLEELKVIFDSYFESNVIYKFPRPIVKFLHKNNFLDIFPYLFDKGYIYELEHTAHTFLFAQIKNSPLSFYIRCPTIIILNDLVVKDIKKLFTTYHIHSDLLCDTFDIDNFDNYSILFKKHIISLIFGDEFTYSNILNSFDCERDFNKLYSYIIKDKQLLNFTIFYLHELDCRNNFIVRFLLQQKDLYIHFNFVDLFLKYQEENYFQKYLEFMTQDKKNNSTISKAIQNYIHSNINTIFLNMEFIPLYLDNLDNVTFSNLLESITSLYGSINFNYLISLINLFLSRPLHKCIQIDSFIFNKNSIIIGSPIPIETIFNETAEIIKKHNFEAFKQNLDHLNPNIRFYFLIDDF